MIKIPVFSTLAALVLLIACRKDPDLHPKNTSIQQGSSTTSSTSGVKTSIGTPYKLVVPPNFPQPDIPADNPMTVEGVKLGRYLFYDSTLSLDNSISCASCHKQSHAFSDAPNAVSTGTKADGYPKGTFNSMPIFNLAWSRKAFFWNGRVQGPLEDQILQPVQNPIEMHMDTNTMVSRLKARDDYKQMFKDAFGDQAITGKLVAKAIAQFVRSIVSVGSKYDKVRDSVPGVTFTALELQGFNLLLQDPSPYNDSRGAPHREKFSGINCGHCHAPPLFTPEASLNVMENDGFGGRNFKTPTLRNLAYTGPYMQDGSKPNIDSVLMHYNRASDDPTIPNMFAAIAGFQMELQPDEVVAVKAFLKTLNDSSLLTNPAYSNPFHK
jgi:cytochrome c peroxidase